MLHMYVYLSLSEKSTLLEVKQEFGENVKRCGQANGKKP